MVDKNLKYYRLMNDLSQEALAQQVGLNKMAISNYENGKRIPDVATMRKLANALNIPMARLVSSDGQNLEIHHGAFRKQSKIGKAIQDLILGCIDRYLARLFNVISVFGEAVLAPVPDINRVKVTNYEEAGLHLRKVLGLPESGPIGNITDILENKGYIICPIDVQENRFSGNSGTVNGRPYIAVNINMPAERQRFTLIHELAHLAFAFDEDQDEERWVDKITGAFLFPESDIKRELGPKRSNIIGDLRQIQREYNVSMASIAIRARQTDIIGEATYENTQKWISANGFRKNEQSGIQPEESHLLEQLTLRAVAEEEITLSRAAELLEKPFIEVRELCFGGV